MKLIIALTPIALVHGSTSLPFTYDQFRRPVMGVRIPRVFGDRNLQSQISLSNTMSATSIVDRPFTTIELVNNENMILNTIDNTQVSLVLPQLEVIEQSGYIRDAFMDPHVFAIGQGSHLMTWANNSIDFIQFSNATGLIRLNGTRESLLSDFCIDGSSMSFEYRFPGQIVVDSETERLEVSVDFRVSSKPYILSLPERIYTLLLEIVNVERFVGPLSSFDSCNATLALLPTIDIESNNGLIRLFPTDYTRRIGNDTCELLVGGMGWAERVIAFNPLLIPGLTARLEPSQVLFCDTSL